MCNPVQPQLLSIIMGHVFPFIAGEMIDNACRRPLCVITFTDIEKKPKDVRKVLSLLSLDVRQS